MKIRMMIKIKEVIEMPYENEHSAIIKESNDFITESLRFKKIADGVRCIIGKIKSGDGSMIAHEYRFKKDKFNADESEKWLRDNKIKYLSVEPAVECKSEIPDKEVRTFDFNFDNEKRKMEGHAAIFNDVTDLSLFREEILPGAFRETIKKDDIRALFNHNEDNILGRNKARTLRLFEDDRGLKVSINPPDTQFARDLAVSMERGDINQMSFAFQVQEEEWISGEKNKTDLRRLKKVRLFDVSVVTFPAYENTDVGMRSNALWRSITKDPEILEYDGEWPPVNEFDNEIILLRKKLNRRI
jgi:HK97 family phage prohead protease